MATSTSLKLKAAQRLRRKRHIRRRIFGETERPRLSVFKSLKHTYVQLVDDVAGRTLCSASTSEKEMRTSLKGTGNKAAAEAVGKAIAERAKALGVKAVVFDRNGFRFHGRVKSLADAARAEGLEF